MQTFQQVERKVDGRRFRVGQIGPPGFIVRLDCRFRFGERQSEAHVAVQVAVRYMVDKLAEDQPSGR